MATPEYWRRKEIVSAIRSLRTPVALEVTDEFLARHPEWQTKYGEAARRYGIEDAGYHQDFLAGAIESGELSAFGDYAEWAARMFKARRIEPHFLAENLDQIAQSL